MYIHIKRILGFGLSLLALAVLSPLMLVLAAVIRATSPGPVFFRQKRVGQGKSHFMIYKFRTMRTDAEEGDLHALLVQHVQEVEDPGQHPHPAFPAIVALQVVQMIPLLQVHG